jgi:D-alanyl-D-alanine carboxypeptidase
MRYWLYLTGVLVFILSCQKDLIPDTQVCQEDESLEVLESHSKGAMIQEILDRYVGLGIPGVQVLISDDEGIWVTSAGFADLSNGILMEPCHINKLGSVTKMMMGSLVWQSIQAGTLELEAMIGTYVPEVAAGITNGDQITVGMLLNHTSGIHDVARDLGFNLAVVNDFTRSWTAEEILSYIEGKPATHEPGAEIEYSNSNTLLLGLILEAVEGIPHGQLLQERILDPLNMTHTVYYDYETDFPSSAIAQGYLDFYNDGNSIQNISTLNPGSANGYTGVYSTVGDMYRFMNGLFREYALIKAENMTFILENTLGEDDQAWRSSYGAIHQEYIDLLPSEQPAYGHAGGDIGYSANLNYFPHNNTIFAATYNYGSNLPSALGEILNDLRKELILVMAQ